MEFFTHASGSAGNLYQVIGRSGEIIIDPGITKKRLKQALKFRLADMQAALVSHSHMDHCKAVGEVARAGVDCYMSSQTAEALGIEHHRIRVIEPLKQFQVGDWSIVGFPTEHDVDGALGFLVSDGHEKLLYATDTYYIHHRFGAVNIIAVECNYSPSTMAPDLNPVRKKRLYKSHFSLENVMKFLKANDMSAVREIHLIHMSRDNSDPRWFKSEIERLTGKPVYTTL